VHELPDYMLAEYQRRVDEATDEEPDSLDIMEPGDRGGGS
jgi:hypothetical protein